MHERVWLLCADSAPGAREILKGRGFAAPSYREHREYVTPPIQSAGYHHGCPQRGIATVGTRPAHGPQRSTLSNAASAPRLPRSACAIRRIVAAIPFVSNEQLHIIPPCSASDFEIMASH